jgi:hypothetical protein
MTALQLEQVTQVPNPSEIASYLLSSDWSLKRDTERWAIYSRPFANGEVEIGVPLVREAADYPRVVARLFEDLERLEDRSAPLIARDVLASGVDIARMTLLGMLTEEGKLPVESARFTYEAARNVLLAAACSEIQPRSVYTKRKPDEAMSFLKQARFALPQLGSYVLSVESPVPPLLQTEPKVVPSGIEPFQRRVMMRLASGLHAAALAVRTASVRGTLDPFREGANEGVSANLCEGVAALIESAESTRVDIRLSFALQRPLRASPLHETSVGKDSIPILREAAQMLRRESTQVGVDVEGLVVKLESASPADGGHVVISAELDGRVRPIGISLTPKEYQVAIEAHANDQLVRCIGDLKREGKSLQLDHLSDFSLLRNAD